MRAAGVHAARADGADVFRNFVVTVPGDGARYVRGFEFRPGGRAVHHANIRLDPTPASRRLDAADPAPGYEGTVLRIRPTIPTAISSAGRRDRPRRWRRATSRGASPPGNDLVVQLHLQPTGKPERLRPSIGLYFTNEPPSAHAGDPAARAPGHRHPAGDAAYARTDSYVLPVDAELRAIQPHAHYRARSVERVGDDSGRRPAAADPDQQLGLQLAGPVPLRDAVLGAGRHEARDGVHVRQLRRQPAQPERIRRRASAGGGDRRTRWPTSGFR